MNPKEFAVQDTATRMTVRELFDRINEFHGDQPVSVGGKQTTVREVIDHLHRHDSASIVTLDPTYADLEHARSTRARRRRMDTLVLIAAGADAGRYSLMGREVL